MIQILFAASALLAVLLLAFTVVVGWKVLFLASGEQRRRRFPPIPGIHPKRTPKLQLDESQEHLSGFVEVNQQAVWWQCFRPAKAPSKAVLVLFHGYADHSDYCVFEIASDIARRGNFTVIAFDQPSFGRSDGLWGYIPNWFEHVRVCMEATRRIRKLVKRAGEESIPLAGMGISMGGGVAITAGILDPTLFDRIVLVAPMCGVSNGIRPHWIVEKIFRSLAVWFPTLPLTPVPNIGRLCYRDPKVYDIHAAENRLCYFAKPRLGTALSMLTAQEWISDNADMLKTPFILFHGDADRVTAPERSLAFAKAVDGTGMHVEIVRDQEHVLIGPDAEPSSNDYVINKILNWVTQPRRS